MVNTVVDILLVEDREEDAEMALMALEEQHISNTIKWVKDGQEALDYLFANGKYAERKNSMRPRVVLLDLKMPKVGGLEVLQQLRDDPRTKDIPVVILTTSKDDGDLKTAYAYGANSYIVKPVDFVQFSSAIRDLGLYWVVLNQPPI